MPSQPKLQRWTDLLAALLRRAVTPVTFDVLRTEVGDYAAHTGNEASLMRKFERDKDELRALGVPLEAVPDADGNLAAYRLAARNFYLPYLQLALEGKPASPPRRPRGPGYQGLQVLAFEPDELEAVARAARRVAALGDPALADEARNAARKLAHDLPLPGEDASEHVIVTDAPDAVVLDAVADALHRRKTLSFRYHSMHRDEVAERTVDPWGLAFLSGHWYLIARDQAADALRQFRVSRIAAPRVNTHREQTADYAIPHDFDLAVHVRSRHAWELGDAEARDVTVRFDAATGAALPAMELGEPIAGDARRRRFRVRRIETFALWILAFAGDATVEDPPEVAERVRDLARAARAQYEGAR